MIENFYWDSCVFYCLLTGQPPQYPAALLEILDDASKGKAKIYTSTAALAEIKPSALRAKGHRTIHDFFDAMQGAVHLIDPNPNIMAAAGSLRDCKPTNPSDAKTTNQRSIGLGDAIHLRTCLYIRDVLGLRNIVFQTFDDGKGKTWEGRCVPLLSFERWFPDPRTQAVAEVCGLKRAVPGLSQHSLFAIASAIANVPGTPMLTNGSSPKLS